MDLDKIRAEIQEELRSNPPETPEDKDLERLLSELAAISPPDPDVIDLLTADDPPVSLSAGWEERRAARIKRAAAMLRARSHSVNGIRVDDQEEHLLIAIDPEPAFLGELLEACRKQSKTTVPEAAEILGAKANDLKNLDAVRDPRFFMNFPPARVARLVERIGCPRPDFASLARRALAQPESFPSSIAAAPASAIAGTDGAAELAALRRAAREHARDVAALEAWLKEFLTA